MKIAIAIAGGAQYGQLTAATAHLVTCLSSAQERFAKIMVMDQHHDNEALLVLL